MNMINKCTAMLGLAFGLTASAFAAATTPESYVAKYKGRTDIPTPIRAVVPVFEAPENAQAKIAFYVDAKGRIQDVEVLETTDEVFASRVKRALSYWKFAPAIDASGNAVTKRVMLPFIYNAEESTSGFGLFASLN